MRGEPLALLPPGAVHDHAVAGGEAAALPQHRHQGAVTVTVAGHGQGQVRLSTASHSLRSWACLGGEYLAFSSDTLSIPISLNSHISGFVSPALCFIVQSLDLQNEQFIYFFTPIKDLLLLGLQSA